MSKYVFDLSIKKLLYTGTSSETINLASLILAIQ